MPINTVLQNLRRTLTEKLRASKLFCHFSTLQKIIKSHPAKLWRRLNSVARESVAHVIDGKITVREKPQIATELNIFY